MTKAHSAKEDAGHRNRIIAGAKNLDISVEILVFALPIFPGSRPPSIVGVHELNFCVWDGREPERCLWQIKRGRSEGSGLQETSLL